MAKMAKTTVAALEKAREYFGEREFTEQEWNRSGIALTLDTARVHGAVIRMEKVERTYYTIREVVDMLNDCSNEDCYGAHWHYEIDAQGRVYDDYVYTTYRMA